MPVPPPKISRLLPKELTGLPPEAGTDREREVSLDRRVARKSTSWRRGRRRRIRSVGAAVPPRRGIRRASWVARSEVHRNLLFITNRGSARPPPASEPRRSRPRQSYVLLAAALGRALLAGFLAAGFFGCRPSWLQPPSPCPERPSSRRSWAAPPLCRPAFRPRPVLQPFLPEPWRPACARSGRASLALGDQLQSLAERDGVRLHRLRDRRVDPAPVDVSAEAAVAHGHRAALRVLAEEACRRRRRPRPSPSDARSPRRASRSPGRSPWAASR